MGKAYVVSYMTKLCRLPKMYCTALLLAASGESDAFAQGVCNGMNFTDVTVSAGITHSYNRPPTAAGVMSGGAVAEDFNNDGWLDLYVVQGDGGPNMLYMNNQAGGFVDEAAARSADLQAACVAASASDFDNDGDIDIGVSVVNGAFRILVNDGTGNFTSEIVLPGALKDTMSSSWGDVDNDGLLELAVGQWNAGEQSFFLYKNLGGTNLSQYEFRTVPHQDIYVFSPRFADLNGDNLADLHVVSDFTNSQLYLNVGGGSFENVTATNGTGGSSGGQNEMGHAIGDYDGDGDLDIFTSNIVDVGGNRLYRNNGAGVFTRVQDTAGVLDGHWGWGASFGDLDNDGDLDLYHVNGWHEASRYINTPARLFMNEGDGTFAEVAACAGADDGGQGKGMLQFDYDNDGDLDIFIVNNMDVAAVGSEAPGTPVLLRNDTNNGNHWLQVTLDGAPPLHRNGIGSRVHVHVGGETMLHEMHASTNYLSQDAGRIAHFGLGSETVVDDVTAEWVTGDATVIPNVVGDQRISVPSPIASPSARVLNLNEVVTADASAEANPVEWEVEGVVYANPLSVSFSSGGIKDLTLNVYNSTQTTIVRKEILRVTVLWPGITSPTPGSVLQGDTATFNWTNNSVAVTDWRLQVGTSVGNASIYDSGLLGAGILSETVSGLPRDGSTIHVRLSYTIDSVTEFTDYTYTADTAPTAPEISNPPAGSALPGSTVTFHFADNGFGTTFWQIWLGSTAGSSNLGDTGVLASSVTSATLTGLPTNGSTVHATLLWTDGELGVAPVRMEEFTYTAAPPAEPRISNPVPGSTLTASTVTFNFDRNGTGTTFWQLLLGSTVGGSDFGDSGILASTVPSTTLSGLPMDGSTIHAMLVWTEGALGAAPVLTKTFTYTGGVLGVPAITSPTPNSVLPGATVTFGWASNSAEVTDWRLMVGTSVGDASLHDSGQLAAGILSETVNGLPIDGSTVYVRLSYTIDAVTEFADYTYTANTAGAVPGISNPPPGSTLAGSTVTFNFADNGRGTTFWQLWLGSTQGANNLGDSGVLSSSVTSTTLSGLPTNGSTIHATLLWVAGELGVDPTQTEQFTYTATAPAIGRPAPSATLAGDTVTFYMEDNNSGVTIWQLLLGTTPGGNDIADSGLVESADLTTLSGLPTDGSTIYATLVWITGALGVAPVQTSAFQYVSGPPAVDDRDPSVAHRWMEVLLDGIRGDFARPTVHARNLWHISAAMYDAWATYDDAATTYLLGKTVDGFTCTYTDSVLDTDVQLAREEAISYAAYRLIHHRFANSPGAATTLAEADDLMEELGFDTSIVSTDTSDGTPAKLGNKIAECYIDFGLQDGSNEQNAYANNFYTPVNPPIEPFEPGNPNIVDLDRWQQISLPIAIDQSGNPILSTPPFLSPEWGQVTPFALSTDDLTIYVRDGFEYYVYHDPGPPPSLFGPFSDWYKWGFALVAIWSGHLDPADGVMIDISPASLGNLDVAEYPTETDLYDLFYDLYEGGDSSMGHPVNPVTGLPYEPQMVPRGDYARVLAEFWADGPQSETPPGHWFTILNTVSGSPLLERRIGGVGEVVGPLEWDIKSYFTLGGAMHDCAVTAWGIKGWYDYLRPVSAIRAMSDLGQSSDPSLASYDPDGIPLHPGFVELVEQGDPLAGEFDENVGKIKLYAWRGPDFVEDPETDVGGVDWILAENWWPYQRPTFVTPPFAGYISGHSTFSRAAAEVLTAFTGSPYFPGGMGEFVAPANNFLVFEQGPSVDIVLQWATYRDASDQTSLSRIWGGIHPPADDIPGRLIGIEIGLDAYDLALTYFGQ